MKNNMKAFDKFFWNEHEKKKKILVLLSFGINIFFIQQIIFESKLKSHA